MLSQKVGQSLGSTISNSCGIGAVFLEKEGHDFIHILRKCKQQLSSKLNILTPGMKVILSYDFLLEVFFNILESRTYYIRYR